MANELRVVGYADETDGEGNVTLYAMRSPLDLAPTVILANPIVLKQLVAKYLLVEADGQLEAAGLTPIASADGKVPDQARTSVAIASALALGGLASK